MTEEWTYDEFQKRLALVVASSLKDFSGDDIKAVVTQAVAQTIRALDMTDMVRKIVAPLVEKAAREYATTEEGQAAIKDAGRIAFNQAVQRLRNY